MSSVRLTVALALMFVTAVALAAPQASRSPNILGGLGPEQEVDDEVRQVVRKANSMLQEKLGDGIERLEPLAYRSQVVAGMNYFVKLLVHYGDGRKEHAHVQIYNRPWDKHMQVVQVRKNVHPDQRIWS